MPLKLIYQAAEIDRVDLLEGESFQPAYTPYSAPEAVYDAGYTPPEQKSIQDAVAAGAASYNGVSCSSLVNTFGNPPLEGIAKIILFL